jgi:hypothetical protein
MAAYKPLQYPDKLTKKHWDKSKSVLAKAAGKTGVGEAADAAQDAFKRIDWTRFDVFRLAPTASNQQTLQQAKAIKVGVQAEWKRSVEPTIAALKVLRTKAQEAAKTYAKNKLLKANATVAEQIAQDADLFVAALQLNGIFFEQVAKEWQLCVGTIERMLAAGEEIKTKTKEYLMQLLSGLAKMQSAATQDMKLWDDVVKQPGRSVSNNLKTNPELAKKHLKTWVTKFKGFDWTTIGFANIKDPTELKTALGKFITEVKSEAQELAKDLK